MILYDNIHGYINIDKIAQSIIDTPVFQRLRSIHQTGVLYLVYPTATHTRFEHSIGTYHLALKMIQGIMVKQPELNITEEICMLVGIAGLCHDLGHLLFSHLFDDIFLPKLPNYPTLLAQTKNIFHENRSILLLNYIVGKYNIMLSKHQLKVIGDLINPKEAEYSKWKPSYHVGKWIFQIISNPINSIDVDKFDYLTRDTMAVGLKLGFDYSRIINDARVIGNMICYSNECSEDIYHMFFLRYRLHRTIYNNTTAKSIEILIIQLLLEIEKELTFSSYILDPEKMLELVDSFIMHSPLQKTNTNITNILNKINTRQFPKLVYQDISIDSKNLDKNKMKEKFNLCYEIIRFKVGYVGGKTNPLNHITFYDLKTGIVTSDNRAKDFSLLITQKYQEHFVRVYCTDLTRYDEFIEFFNNSDKKINTGGISELDDNILPKTDDNILSKTDDNILFKTDDNILFTPSHI